MLRVTPCNLFSKHSRWLGVPCSAYPLCSYTEEPGPLRETFIIIAKEMGEFSGEESECG